MEIIIGLLILYIIYRVIKGISQTKRSSKGNEITIRVETSGPVDFRNNYKRDDEPKGEPATWLGYSKPINIQGYDIPDGLIYVGTNLPDYSGYANDACLINPKLKVSSADPWEAGEDMDYWPSYSRIPKKCRGAFLKWLATGRSEPETYIGYVFLFFYGLERRLFVDGSKGIVCENERVAIVNEVKRLLKIYKGAIHFVTLLIAKTLVVIR